MNQLSFISQFTTDIDSIEGSKIVVTDDLSRIKAVSLLINYEDLVRSQNDDESIHHFLKNSQSSINLDKVMLPGSLISIYCDTSTGKPYPFLTTYFWRNAFNTIHDLNHPGIKITYKLLT